MRSIFMRRLLFTAVICALLISLGAAINSTYALDNYVKLENALRDGSIIEASKPSDDDGTFYVRAHEDKIGVFDSQNNLLYTVEVYIKTLPANDRALLTEGIRAQSCEELYEILGDYDA